MSDIKVSVIMGIYNCEKTLYESLNSLLHQTYTNFEVIMCDDGSIDNSYNIAKEFVDKQPQKFKLFKNERNLGLNETLNQCLKLAKGEYIARMDGDDISLPDRLSKQVTFLNNNPDIAIVSTPMIHFDDLNGDWGLGKMIEKPEKKDLIKSSVFAHAACMVRKEAYDTVDGYSVSNRLLRVEDYHLWIKMYEAGYKGYNLAEPLYKMRDNKEAYSRRTLNNRINETFVKYIALRKFRLPFWNSIYLLKPILTLMLPTQAYDYLHKKKLSYEDD